MYLSQLGLVYTTELQLTFNFLKPNVHNVYRITYLDPES